VPADPHVPRRRPRSAPPNPLLAAFLSALIPGLGQLYGGDRRRGWLFVGISAALVLPAGVLLALVLFGGGLQLALAISQPFFDNPNLLILLLVLNVILLAFRVVAIVDAFLGARSGPGWLGTDRPAAAAAIATGLAALLLATAIPHAWVGQRNLLLYDAFTHNYVLDPNQAATTTLPAPDGDGTTTSATTTTSTLPAAFPQEGRVNILLLGGDAGVGRSGIRTDTMIVLSIDPSTGWTAMFGIPRNLIDMPLPPGSPAQGAWACGDCFPKIANEIYEWGLERPDLFGGPNSGANAAKSLIGYLLGIDIQYFALVDLDGFVDVIDAVGGVDIVVTERIYDTQYPNEDGTFSVMDLQPGTYHMDGHLALYYARSRQGSTDFDRMSRQRCVLEALAAQADPVTLLREFPTIVPAIEQSVHTDIPISTVPDLIRLLAKVNTQEIVSIRFMPNAPEFAGTPTSYIADWTTDRYPIPDRDFIAQTVATALSLPPLEAIRVLNLQPLTDVCGTGQS
jgi:LCP family protein required for cell wall assembly